MKKLLVVLLVFAISIASLSAGGNNEAKDGAVLEDTASNVNPPGVFPIVKEPIQVKMYITPSAKVIDIETNEALKYIEELTGIDLVLTVGPEQAKEKINLMLASQTDLPEVFLTYEGISMEQVSINGEYGVFEPIDHLLEKWAPNTMRAFEYQPDIRRQITAPDGHIYSFSNYSEGQHVMHSQKMWVNQKWLERVGLEEPTNLKEFKNMLVAFKEKDANGNGDPTDEIPLGSIADNTWRADIFGFLMNPFVPTIDFKEAYLYNDKGTIKNSVQQAGWKDGLYYMKDLYDEGLLDQEAFVLTKPQMKALVMNPEGVMVGAIPAGAPGPFINSALPGPRDEYNAIAPLTQVNGDRPRTPYFKPKALPRFVITSEAKNLEAIVRLGDLLMIDPFSGKPGDLEMGLNVWYGPNGWTKPADGVKGNNGSQALYEWAFSFNDPTNLNFANLPGLFSQKLKKGSMVAKKGFDLETLLWNVTEEKYEPYSDPVFVPPVIINNDDVSEAGEIKQILMDYMKENNAKFVMGIRDLDTEWDTYQEELITLGLNRYVGMVQTAYNRQYK
ncbi:MAG: extracellular solute-binding protein [Spirochaetaceae bacterium]